MTSSVDLTQSSGYAGKLDDSHFARMQAMTGFGRQVVQTSASCLVVADPTRDRGVIVKAGAALGDNILDDLTDTPVQFDPPTGLAAGQVWYGAVVLTRDWARKTSSVRAVLGNTSSKVAPAALTSTAGVKSDQVLALCAVTGGSATVTDISDRRSWSDGARGFSAARSSDGPVFNTNVQQSYVHLGSLAPAGQYRISGVAAAQTTTTGASVVGLLGVSVSVDGGAAGQIGVQLYHSVNFGVGVTPYEAVYNHPGGLLSMDLVSLYSIPVKPLTGSCLTATWIAALS